MWFLNLQTFLTSPWFSLTLFILIFVLVLKIHTLQQQQIKLGSAASLKQDLLQQTIIQKGENLYQLAAAWLDVSDKLQQLNYDYLNARIVPEDYAFQLDHLLEEPGYDVGQIEMLIQVYFLYYVLPNYGVSMTAMQVGILGIGLHYACYIAEVYRGGLDAVPRAQWEAVTALNIAPYSAYRNIILPQALRPILPPLGNYLVAMLKDTPVLSAITVVEIMQQAKNIGSENFRYLEPITMVGLFFLALSIALAYLVRRLEVRLELR